MTGNPHLTPLLPTHIIRRGPKSDRSYLRVADHSGVDPFRQQYGIYGEINEGLGQPMLKRQPGGAFMPTDPIAVFPARIFF
jgi:hypothetical protein